MYTSRRGTTATVSVKQARPRWVVQNDVEVAVHVAHGRLHVRDREPRSVIVEARVGFTVPRSVARVCARRGCRCPPKPVEDRGDDVVLFGSVRRRHVPRETTVPGPFSGLDRAGKAQHGSQRPIEHRVDQVHHAVRPVKPECGVPARELPPPHTVNALEHRRVPSRLAGFGVWCWGDALRHALHPETEGAGGGARYLDDGGLQGANASNGIGTQIAGRCIRIGRQRCVRVRRVERRGGGR